MTAIVSEETRLRDSICRIGESLFNRGLTSGPTGNISTRLSDGGLLMTPTNASLGALEAESLSLIDDEGRHLGGDKPTKEAFLHTCLYCARNSARAVIHLHSTHSVAVSVLADINAADVLPPLTAYYVMRIGRLPMVPYFPPGDRKLALAVEGQAYQHHAILLANHGPILAANSLMEAQYGIEELEETAKLFLLLQGRAIRPLTEAQADLLRR